MNETLPTVWTIIGGAFRLQPQAFQEAIRLPNGWYVATAVILLAGLSEALGQSVVLFANKVKRERFIFCIAVNVLLFGFGYLFALVSTWAILRLPGLRHTAFDHLAIALALSYVPLLFAFMVALPYLGYGIGWLLRTLHLLAMVVAVVAAVGVDALSAFIYVGIGWLGLSIAQQTFGRPIALLGERLLNAVAGVEITSNEQLAIDRMPAGQKPPIVDGAAANAGGAAVAAGAPARSTRWTAVIGIMTIGIVGYILALTLTPVHQTLFGWQTHLPRAAQLPLNLLWIAMVGVLVAGFMAPIETLGWWAGWYGDALKDSGAAAAPVSEGGPSVARYVVYLDGISQSGDSYTPDVETFLDALSPRLPKNYRLVRGVMTYSVLNRPLDQDPVLSWFWRFVEDRRSKNVQSLLGMFINIRNVFVVAVSADTRYGPIYNYGIGQLVYDALMASGYRANSGTPVTFIGYSGGGQMSAASAATVKRALGAPVDVISLGGVISGNVRILELEHLYHFAGERDRVQKLGPIMFPSRWKIAPLSNWNRAARLGRLSIFSLGPVGHQVPGGLLDPEATLPDGQSFLDQTLDRIEKVLSGRIERARPAVTQTQSNYGRYIASVWNTPLAYPVGASVDETLFVPSGEWSGRLVLPSVREREHVRGAWFEVHTAPKAHHALIGTKVRLRWSETGQAQTILRAVTRDVHFSAAADYSSQYKGLVQPVRVDHWRLVDPLESLAGARPVDDIVVALSGPVEVEGGNSAILRIRRQPVQISGRYRAVVRFTGKVDGDLYGVVHFNRATRAFDGPAATVRAPVPVPDGAGRSPSNMRDIQTAIDDAGWHVYGSPDAAGTFVVQAMLPRRPLLLAAERSLSKDLAYRYVKKGLWRDIVARKGSAFTVQLGESDWRLGDRALVLHVYGGIGGAQTERPGPFYFGHFSCGVAEVVHDELTDEPRFDIVYEQVYTHNVDGIVAGALHMSRYLGDRQFGWAWLRPTANVLLKLDPFTSDFHFSGARRSSALDGVVMQLEAMTARYRIGDGTGASFVGAVNNCAQDTGRAFVAATGTLDQFVRSDAFAAWQRERPGEASRFEELLTLSQDLRRKLQPRGSNRDSSENDYELGTTMTDDLLESIKISFNSWRTLLPRLANDSIAKVFFGNGATGRVIATAQLGAGEEVEPVVPATLPF